MSEPRFIDAYDMTTGAKLDHPVPEHWLTHPVLGANLSKIPRQKAADKGRKATDKPAIGEAEKEQ